MTRDYLASYNVDEAGCWNYSGSIGRKGYGQILKTTAHRYFYTALVGDIPEGLQIDHLCENTRCVNPEHLEPVTGAENMARRYQRPGICKCGRPVPGVSLTLRVRGNPRPVCGTCPAFRGFADIFDLYFSHRTVARSSPEADRS